MVSGNPSISDVMSSYMLGLRKCKVAKGEIPTSAWAISPGTLRSPEMPGNWCGGNMQKLLQVVYLITFTCLLWINEVLKIQVYDIDFGIDDIDGIHFVSITLPFHKSSPFGIKNMAMKPEVFLQLFCNNLCDLKEPPYAYGTHSFHHGGCQWLSVDLHWLICQICEWGG
ncbi:hypothetical protein IW262DRAFT_1300670 [Armillaria fumosa]|nr:hypothetical protein IW262DRAFT_1300670 [Armillaria fumosa]